MYFQKTDFISRGDPFRNAAQMAMRSEVKDGWQKAGHEKNFKPAKDTNERNYRTPYPNMPQGNPPKDPRAYRDEEGAVKTAPINLYTNPMKKGRTGKSVTFGAFPFMDGNKYDIQRDLDNKEREYHISKIQEKPFSNRAKHTVTFNTHKEILAEEPLIPAKPPKEKEEAHDIHDGKAFKPANPTKKGYKGTFVKFPEHMPNPPTEKTRAKLADDAPEPPPGFKATYRFRSRPTPSIATNYRNLKASYPMAFSRSPNR